jgi:uncharacterized protein YxjI
MTVDLNEHDLFLLRQRIRPVVNQYDFTLAGPDGEPGQRVCFVEQKRFKLKEDIRFYVDETKREEIMRLKARRRFDPAARYDVTDAAGARIGQIQKVFKASLLRSTLRLYDAQEAEVATAVESNMAVALIRRFVRLIPVVGEYADWLPIPYHFVFRGGDDVLGHHRRRALKFRDTYTIDMTPDVDRRLDRRLVLAVAVAMDALQAR